MNKINLILVFLSVVTVFFLSGCDVYEKLYGGEAEFLPLEDISSEVDKTLEDILPTEVEEEEVELVEIEEGVEEVIEIEVGEEEIIEVEVEEEEVVEVGEAIVIAVQETDLISLAPQAEDEDEDIITFTFSTPLDENGKWSTTYGDAGEYTVTVTASDGQSTTSQDVLIIVNKKEEIPTIDSFKPEGSAVTIKETEDASFNIEASDLNKDELSYVWKLDGEDVGNDENYIFETTYDDSGSHTVKAEVSDGTEAVSQLWSVTVENVNRKPILGDISTIEVKETETITIEPEANDPDGDEVSFTISEPVGDEGTWETTYDDAGEYTVTVTASDGTDSVSQDVNIVIENVNRPPVIVGIVQNS